MNAKEVQPARPRGFRVQPARPRGFRVWSPAKFSCDDATDGTAEPLPPDTPPTPPRDMALLMLLVGPDRPVDLPNTPAGQGGQVQGCGC